MCHCLGCQQRSGSVFAIQARWASQNVHIEGPANRYVRTGDAGGKMTASFCPTCGVTVFFEVDKMAGMVAVPVGTFADPTFPAPTVSVYEARKHAWVASPTNAQHLD